MSCRDGIDPADFEPGRIDPTTDPAPILPEMSISDAIIVSDGAGGLQAEFEVLLTNANYTDTVTAQWDTADGTATAGTYYTARTGQSLSIPIGEAAVTLVVALLDPGIAGIKTFYVNLSSPANCTILDDQGAATYSYTAAPPPPPPPPPPSDAQYTAWPKPGIVYDQTADCAYLYACTGAACGSAMSALHYRATGANKRFDWQKLYHDAGGCTQCCGSKPTGCTGGCNGEREIKMLKWMRDHGIAINGTSNVYKISSFSQITATTVSGLITKIKATLKETGVVHVGSKWYETPQHGWLRCKSCADYVLRNPDKNGIYGANDALVGCASWAGDLSSGSGHVWVITGWNDYYKRTGGAFEILSSYGTSWGAAGRAWMPYSYFKTGWTYYKLIYGGVT